MLITRSMHSGNQLPYQSKCGLWLLVVFLLFASYEVQAKERAFRVFDQSNGLPVSSLSGLAQDTNGFFWLGTAAGLYRFDGLEFRHWAKDKIAGWHYQIFTGPNGQVLVTCLPDNTLYRVLPNEDAEIIIGPDGKPFADVHDAAFTRDGRLWVSRLDGLFYRNDGQQWVEMPREIRGDERIWQLSAGLDETLWVTTTHSIWKINPDLSYQKVLTRDFDGYIGNVIAHPDGSLFYMEKYPQGGKIFQYRNGQVVERVALKTNLHDFALRGDTVWANGDRYMVALKPNREPEVLEAGKDAPIGGGMVVDNEGSLWMSDGIQLIQVPEPDTEIWTAHDGLPELAAIALKETEEGVWVSTWSGLAHLERGAGDQWHARTDRLMHMAEMCNDGQGSLWLSDFHNFWQRAHGELIKYPQQASGSPGGCDSAVDGGVWMSTSRGLWRLQSGQSPLLVNPPLSPDEAGKVFEDSRGRLWLTNNEDICHAPAAPLKAGQPVKWSCETIKGSRVIGKPIELADGSLWAGTDMLGVWRRTDEAGWQSVPASSRLVSKATGRLVPSPSGGVWVLGYTARIRVLPRPDLPEGWQIVEQLSSLQGIPSGSIDLIEAADRGLWLSTVKGLAHLPASARYPKLQSPHVELVGLLINGQRVDSTSAPQIPAGRNQVELQFAVLSFRDRSLLRYQYKLHPNDAWSESSSSLPVFRFYDLRSGNYAVEIRASLDGVSWSDVPAHIGFQVLSPWYFRWWAIGLFTLLTAMALLVAHRIRVRLLLQLERQRTRIAMDLHDEIGSGLGSIGILSSVAASTTVDESQRQELTRQIADTASELGSSLTDIVWSLRKESATMEGLAYHLTRRAGKLFSNGAAFTTEFPDAWEEVNLSLTTRRNVLLIALEAIHNAVRHANARQVVLGLAPVGRSWKLWVEDDGCGMNGDDDPRPRERGWA